MKKDISRDLSILEHPLIRNEGDLERISDCVDYKNFSWPFETYCETSPAGNYWILKSIGESIGVSQNSKFCDIGFGSGVVLATFAILGYQTYGIDKLNQPLEHALDFFKKVQDIFGEFKYQPQIIKGEIEQNKDANFGFPNGASIKEMDFYYAYVNEEPESPPVLLQSINPKKGAIAIHFSGYFHTPERFQLNAEKYPYLYHDGPIDLPTYKGLGFRLLNDDKLNREVFEKEHVGSMQHTYNAIFIKD